MSNAPGEIWPWIVVAMLGVYHGVNPAMGWLFAVALGLHRRSQQVVAVSLAPIAVGHLASTGLMVAAFLLLGLVVDRTVLTRLAAGLLIAWAIWHALYGHRRRPLVGMQTGLLGLAAWSFVMASAHGAGLMLVPALLPLCASSVPAAPLTGSALLPALAALGLHAAAMLATIALISFAVYNWIGVAFLRRGWINLDLIWIGALLGCGMFLLAQPAA
jgi:hypothetical protein